jgi:prolyl-tRNA editing enzyme YbaK/EbsC (Cys-tRNA(Pro) deacylase)
MEENALPPSAQKVQNELRRMGVPAVVMQLPASTRTAQEAAQAIGCQVRQIAKSLIFRTTESDTPILVIASGAHRVDPHALEEHLGEPVEIADPAFVREISGYAIGGVPPVAHQSKLVTIVDKSLGGYSVIWAAAGTPRTVFSITPGELLRITGGRECTLAARNAGI